MTDKEMIDFLYKENFKLLISPIILFIIILILFTCSLICVISKPYFCGGWYCLSISIILYILNFALFLNSI